jgi:esterase/lipase superfamily enzyme
VAFEVDVSSKSIDVKITKCINVYKYFIYIGALFIFLLAGVVGCAVVPAEEVEPSEVLVEIMYGTDRNVTGESEVKSFYGEERGEMNYGMARVAIRIDKSKSPFADYSIWDLRLKGSTSKSAELVHIVPLTREHFLSSVSERIRVSSDKSALVYTHGYARKFERGAQTMAKLVYELRYQGIPVLYSWPSKGSAGAYLGDRTTIEWSAPNFYKFLRGLSLNTKVETIHVVAHSMGNQAFLKAFMKLLDDPKITNNWKFGEIVLVAPDVDRGLFERDIAPVIVQAKSRITLYVSDSDVPLQASKKVNLYPRVGDASIDPVIINGIETIDASEAASLTTGHSYYRESSEVLADQYYLINQRKAADQRPTLKAVESAAGRYWKIKEVYVRE